MAKHSIVLIPGDGIGPEVMVAARHVLESAGLEVEWDRNAGRGVGGGKGR